jgi:isochorismate pyruvate lyase
LIQGSDNRLQFAAPEPERCQTLQQVRDGVDEIDLLLLDLLVRRQAYTVRAARLKRDAGSQVRDEARVNYQIERAKALGAQRGISPLLIEPLFRLMIEQHIKYETIHHAQA